MRPFKIVDDRGFQCLMKTGQPDHYIPSAKTVSRDVKKVFTQCRQRIAKTLNVCGLDQFQWGMEILIPTRTMTER